MTDTMFTKAALGLAISLATASGTLAATKTQSTTLSQNVYNPAGAHVYSPAYVGSDPDLNVRFEMFRDWTRGH
jgi:hypothetical protein